MSEIRANTVSDAAGTGPVTLTKQSAAKAWVNFNGTGTAAIRDSFNVSSLTDNAVGDYTLSFTNSFSSANYCGGGLGSVGNAGNGWGDLVVRDVNAAPTASTIRLGHITYTDWSDCTFGLPAFHGDLA